MKRISILLLIMGNALWGCAQESSDSSRWELSADANFYFLPGDFFFLPVIRADKNKLHLEARYNYEDRQTVSAWVGYNFSGGRKAEYTITPMLGGVTGLTDGIAPGLELTLNIKRFEFYSESEFLFDLGGKENSFYYNWTDVTYSAKDWLFFGLSAQRTRVYKTDLEIQRGVFLGVGMKGLELKTYLYNLGFDDPFVLLTASWNLR